MKLFQRKASVTMASINEFKYNPETLLTCSMTAIIEMWIRKLPTEKEIRYVKILCEYNIIV